MKTFGFTPKLVAFSALVGLSASISLAAPQTGSAKVTSVKGTAQVNDAPAQVNMKIAPGSVVSTGAESELYLYLGVNGPTATVMADSRLSIDELTYDDAGAETVISTKLGLKSGKVAGVVRKTSDQSTYTVETPVTTAAIRGTKYLVAADGSVKVWEGCVNVVFRNVNYTVCAGQQFDPNIPGVIAMDEPWIQPPPPVAPTAPPATGPIVTVSPIAPNGGPEATPTDTED